MTLFRAVRAEGASGEALHTVFTKLSQRGVEFRRGELHLIAAPPGAGKTVLALAMALYVGRPTFYFSPDSTASTMWERLGGMVTGRTLDEIRKGIDGTLEKTLNQELNHIQWCFDNPLDCDAIDDEMKAYAVVWGDWPELVVIDNLADFTDPSFPDGWEAQERALEFLKSLAKQTHAAIVVLHHVTGQYVDQDRSIPLSGLRGQVGRIPELVLTVRRMGGGVLAVDVVKHRHGEANAAGGFGVHMAVDLTRMRVNDVRRHRPQQGPWEALDQGRGDDPPW
jgi:replicative DNA helicase